VYCTSKVPKSKDEQTDENWIRVIREGSFLEADRNRNKTGQEPEADCSWVLCLHHTRAGELTSQVQNIPHTTAHRTTGQAGWAAATEERKRALARLSSCVSSLPVSDLVFVCVRDTGKGA